MSNSMPHVKWYGRDWLGDHQVRMLSLPERGLWIDLLCAMMSCEPYGHLAIAGDPMPDEDAARMIGVDITTYRDTLARIERVGVSSRTSTGVLYSRRLVRDYQAYTKASESGRRGGGNPSLIRSQKSEAITQKPEATEALKVPIKVPIKVDSSFEELWKAYPSKTGKENALKAWEKWAKAGDTTEQALAGIRRYVAYVEATRKGGFADLKYQNGSTFFRGRGWISEWAIEARASSGQHPTVTSFGGIDCNER